MKKFRIDGDLGVAMAKERRKGEGREKGERRNGRRYRSERGGFNFFRLLFVSVHMGEMGRKKNECKNDQIVAVHLIITSHPFVIVTVTFYQHVPDLATSSC